MRLKFVTLFAVAFAAVSFVTAARAVDLDDSRFNIRGFGTVAATTEWNSDDMGFRRNVGQPEAVKDGELTLANDSILGAQVSARLSSDFDFVVQGLTRLRADDSWKPNVAQGFVRYSPDESLVVRAGRVGFDIYLLAESRQVGYSYLALRPSPDFYGLLTNDGIDGADVAWSRRLGHGIFRARAFGGRSSSETASLLLGTARSSGGTFGGTLDYTLRGFTARAAFVSFGYKTSAGLKQLAGAMMLTGAPPAVALAEHLDHDQLRSKGLQLGVAYDDGPFEAQLLYGSVRSDSIAGPEFHNVYALAGYRIAAFTPFASFAQSRDRHAIRGTGLPDLPMFAPINAGVASIQESSRSTQRTVSAGVRYDFSPRFDLKLQVDRVDVGDSSIMFDYRTLQGSPPGTGQMTVAALALDFVF